MVYRHPLNAVLPRSQNEPALFPYEITFVDCPSSPAARSQIEGYLAKIGHTYGRITRGQVFVRIPYRRRRPFFNVHIQLDIPGHRLVVNREPVNKECHSDIRLAISDAFHKLARQLDDMRP